ncbi:MAG: FtsK/SpoIIIE domain-containing protein [Sarcina sp.]
MSKQKSSNILEPFVDIFCDAGAVIWKYSSKFACNKLGIKTEQDKKEEAERIETMMRENAEEEKLRIEKEIESRNTLLIGDRTLNFNELFFNCGLKNKLKDMPVLEEVKNYKQVDIYSFKLPTGVTVSTVQQKIEEIADFFEIPIMNIKLEKKNGMMDIAITKENLYREVFNYEEIHFKDSKHPNNLKFPLGHFINQNYMHRLLSIDLASDDNPHTFIGSSTGGGKSNLIRTILLNWIMTKTPKELELFLLDGKGGTDYVIFEKAPHVFMNKCFFHPQDVLEILESNTKEILRRNQEFKNVKAKDYDEYVKNGHKMPRRVIIFDEYATFNTDKKVFDEIQKLAGGICARGRSAGIHMIIATQDGQKAVLDSMLKYNLKMKIGFRCDNEQHSINISGHTGLQTLKHKGVGRVFGLPVETDYIQFKAILSPSSSQIEKMINDKYKDCKPSTIKLIDGNYKEVSERSLLNKNNINLDKDSDEGWGD